MYFCKRIINGFEQDKFNIFKRKLENYLGFLYQQVPDDWRFGIPGYHISCAAILF